ncbi:MAG: arginine deiminase [Actinomycetia bacterium]|jgi:arginine deiminase|nr:arginine deiminase [Actinomycetes bacterium]
MAFHVDSEVGALKQVILHRPGLELTRLTPSNVHELLFDDVMWAGRARQEHDQFARRLREHGVTVHLYADLLAAALDAPGARDFLKQRLTNATQFGPALDKPLDEFVDGTPGERLAELLIGGVLKSDVTAPATTSLLWSHLDDEDFLFTPLPNHLFPRDNSAFVYGGVSVNPMAEIARKRETLHSRIIWNFHPLFRDAGLHFYYGNDDVDHEPATVEGGDILVIGNGAVMIGMSQRTSPQGAELLARAFFASGMVTRVIAVELPKTRAFAFLDTAMTMVDRDAFSVYPYLDLSLRSYTLTPRGSGGDFSVTENRDLFGPVAEAVGVEQIRVLKAPIDVKGAEREQWDDGNNFLALSPGVVVGYERNTTTNRYLSDQGIEVIAIVGSELGRAHGGPRALSCPIERHPVE